MTEKDQQPTTQPAQTQSFYHTAEDEINLMDVLEVLLRKKVLILASIAIFTLLSIFYAKSITPTFEVSTSFTKPQETFLAILPSDIAKYLPGGIQVEGGAQSEINNSYFRPTAFSIFLSKVTSYNFQKEVFKDGEFLKKFYDKSSTADIRSALVGIHNSIEISKEKASIELLDYEKPIFLKMRGPNPKAMSEFLNVLTETAKQATIKEIKDQISLIINNQTIKISREIDILRSVAEEQAVKDKIIFAEALITAKNLGIENNNFDKLKSSNIDVGVSSQARTSLDLRSAALENFLESQEKTTIKVQDTTLPVWYLYGEKALQQELDTIKSRKNEAPIPGISLKKISLKKYDSIDPSSLNIKVATIVQSSIPPADPILPRKRIIIATGIALGLFVGLIAVFLSHLATQLREKETPSASATESSTH